MDQLVLFDYGALDASVRVAVEGHTAAIHELARRSARDLVEIGEHLLAVKPTLGHGQFLKWLGHEFSWTPRTAQRFMEVAECVRANKYDKLSPLPGASVLCLLAQQGTPAEVRDAIFERTADGVRVSVAETRSLIDAAKPTTARSARADDTAPQSLLDAADDLESDDPPTVDQPLAQFEWPEEPQASPEERAFYALARQRLVTRFSPESIAAECIHPEDDLPGFRELAAWLTTFVSKLEQRARQPLRMVD